MSTYLTGRRWREQHKFSYRLRLRSRNRSDLDLVETVAEPARPVSGDVATPDLAQIAWRVWARHGFPHTVTGMAAILAVVLPEHDKRKGDTPWTTPAGAHPPTPQPTAVASKRQP